MAPKKRKSKLRVSTRRDKVVAGGGKELKCDEKQNKCSADCGEVPLSYERRSVATSSTPSNQTDGGGRGRKTTNSTPGRKYISHFRSETMTTSSSPSLLDLTVSYDYSTDVNLDDVNLPRPTMQQLTQLFPFKDSPKDLSSTNNVLSILHGLSPACSAPPTKRAKLRTATRSCDASETTPTSSSHPPKSKLDILLHQLRQRLSETNHEEIPLPSDTGFQGEPLDDSNSESDFNMKVETSQEIRDGHDELEMDRQESLESSDNEEMLFWTQAATELGYCDNDGDNPLQREENERTQTDESAKKNSAFDLNQPWDTEADDFIDQLLITGAEGETISSSPDPLPDTNDPSNTSKDIQSNIRTLRQKCSTDCVQSTSETTVCTVTTTDIHSTDGDRIPTPPLPLTRQPLCSHSQTRNIRATPRKSPRRPPSWRLAQEDARSTPPLPPLTGESVLEKIPPFQKFVSPSLKASKGQTVYERDNVHHVQVPNVTRLVAGNFSNARESAHDARKISPQPEITSPSYHPTCTSAAAGGLTVHHYKDNAQMHSAVSNTRPTVELVSSSLSNSCCYTQNADSARHSGCIASFSGGQSSKECTSVIYGQPLSTHMVPQTQNCTQAKLSPFKKATVLDHQGIKGTTMSANIGHRTLSKPLLQSTCDRQHSIISPPTNRSTDCSNATQQQISGKFQLIPIINARQCRPFISEAVSKECQCSKAEIERKRALARSKLQAKKKASQRNCYH